MAKLFSKWPAKVMKSKWRVSKYLTDPTAIVSVATGHNFISVGCEGYTDPENEKNIAIEREIAEHIVELHNSQLKK